MYVHISFSLNLHYFCCTTFLLILNRALKKMLDFILPSGVTIIIFLFVLCFKNVYFNDDIRKFCTLKKIFEFLF